MHVSLFGYKLYGVAKLDIHWCEYSKGEWLDVIECTRFVDVKKMFDFIFVSGKFIEGIVMGQIIILLIK